MAHNMFSRTFTSVFIVVLMWNSIQCNQNYEASVNASREFHALLNRNTFDPQERPYGNDGVVNVTMEIVINSLGPIDAQSFTYRVDYFLALRWNDERLKFLQGEVKFSGQAKDKIWVPDIYVINSREVKKHSLIDTFLTKVESNGDVFWSTRVSEICSCPMNLRNFPMDIQRCRLSLESYAYNILDLRLNWNVNPVTYSKDMNLNDYELRDITAETNSIFYNEDEFQRLELIIKVERTLMNYLTRLYLPTMCLVVITWGTFWLPPSSYPARVAIIVTNFLASVLLLQNFSTFTKVPYMTAIEVFFVVNIMFIVACMGEYMLTINYKRIKYHVKRLSRYSKRRSSKELPLKRRSETIDKQKPVTLPLTDKISRILFPAVYFTFVIVYFSSYLYADS